MTLTLAHSNVAAPQKKASDQLVYTVVKQDTVERIGRPAPSLGYYVMIDGVQGSPEWIDCGMDGDKANYIAREKVKNNAKANNLVVLQETPYVALDPRDVKNIFTDAETVIVSFNSRQSGIALDQNSEAEALTVCEQLKAAVICAKSEIRRESMASVECTKSDAGTTNVVRPAAFNPR